MAALSEFMNEVPGFTVPVHRALTEHILLGGAPRAIAILNGTLAAAIGLGLRLWLVGLGIWAVGHFAAGCAVIIMRRRASSSIARSGSRGRAIRGTRRSCSASRVPTVGRVV